MIKNPSLCYQLKFSNRDFMDLIFLDNLVNN